MGFLGVFLIAALATAATIGMRTGSHSPYFPSVSRSESPGLFWAVIAVFAAIVALNIVHLIFWS